MARPNTRLHENENAEVQSDGQNLQFGTPLTMEAFIQAIEVLSQRQTRESAPQPQQPPEPCNTITDFKKLSPPSFCGSIDLLEAEKWLTEIERTFSVFHCSEEEKVSRAAYTL